MHKSVQILAEPRIELGTLWLEGRDLSNCANHARPVSTKLRLNCLLLGRECNFLDVGSASVQTNKASKTVAVDSDNG